MCYFKLCRGARWGPALDFVRAEPCDATVIRKIGLADPPPIVR